MASGIMPGWWTNRRTRRKNGRPKTNYRARLGVDSLENRVVPSSSIPLNGFTWTSMGPSPVTNGEFPSRGMSGSATIGVAVDSANPNNIYIQSGFGGVWRSTDGGASWSSRTDQQPSLTGSGIAAISRPGGNTLYASSGAGILKSTDGGTTFTLLPGSPIAEGVPIPILVLPDVTDPNNPDKDLIFSAGFSGTTFANGVHRSTNGGATWQDITNFSDFTNVFQGGTLITDIQFDKSNARVLYVCLGNSAGSLLNGVYKSTNALVADPTQVRFNLLIGGSALLPGFIPGSVRMAIAPSLPSVLFASVAERQDVNTGFDRYLGFFRSFDGGANWQRMPNTPDFVGTEGFNNNTIAISPNSPTNPNQQVLFLAGLGDSAGNVYTSADSGNTWQDISVGVNGVGPYINNHSATFDSVGRMLLVSEGGVFRLNSLSPLIWQSLNGNPGLNGLNVQTITSSALPSTDPNRIISSLGNDHTVALFQDAPGTGLAAYGWRTLDSQPGPPHHNSPEGFGTVLWNPNNASIIYRTSLGGANDPDYIRRTLDGGVTWTGISAGITGPGGVTYPPPPLIFDPSNTNRLFVATDDISISENGGDTWGHTIRPTPTSVVTVPALPSAGRTNPGPFFVTAIATSRQFGGQVLLAGVPQFAVTVMGVTTLRPRLYAIIIPDAPTNPGPMWIDLSGNINNGGPLGDFETVTSITVDPADTRNVYITTTGADDFIDHVYLGTTTVGLFDTWTDLTGDLGAQVFGVNALALDSRVTTDPTDDVIYVGTSSGVWRLDDPTAANPQWSEVGLDPATGLNTMPNVAVTDLDLNTTTGILNASTFGRGVFQIQIRGLVSGRKYEDFNGNGVFDAGENPIENFVIRLVNADNGFEVASTTTDASGFYEFRSITNGNYIVAEIQKPGFTQSTAPPPVLFNFTEQSTAVGTFIGSIAQPPSYQVFPDLNFGNFRFATISGIKFDDRDGDGIFDAGEPGLQGFRIFIDTNNDGIPNNGERETVSAADGTYSFANVGPGSFTVREVQQAGFQQTSVNPNPIVPLSGQVSSGVNFGNIRIARISGLIFNDLNGDGIRQGTDPGVGNFILQLINPATGVEVRRTTSAPDGSYVFLSLVAGTYQIREIPLTGWIQTSPPNTQTSNTFYTATVTASGNLTGFEFGNFQLFSVTGIKFEDLNGNGVRESGEPGLSGFVINVRNLTLNTNASTVTSANGTYTVPNLGPGLYQVTETQKAGFVQTTANPPNFVAVSGTNRGLNDFGNFKLVTVTGNIYNDVNGNGVKDAGELGLPGFTVLLDKLRDGTIDAQAVSDMSGNYSFPALGPGGYFVRQQPKRGWTITAPSVGQYSFTAVSGINPVGLNFGNINRGIYVAGRDAGSAPQVSVRLVTTNQELFNFMAYDVKFGGGVRVATGFVTGTPTPSIITAAGAGGGPHVRVWNGNTGDEIFGFFAYGASFSGGVYVAAGDVNGDGFDDIITGAGQGGGPHVRVISGKTRQEMWGFYAFDPNFLGGARVAAGDVDADGKSDVIVAAGPGGGPNVRVFSGATGQLIRDFFAYGANFSGGVTVSAGDYNGDGKADIVTGPGAGGGPDVRVYSGTNLGLLGQVFAYEANYRGGVRVLAIDVNFDNRVDLVVSPGPGRQPAVKTYTLSGTTFQQLSNFNVFDPSFLGGVFVG